MSFIGAALIGAGGLLGSSIIGSLNNKGQPNIQDQYTQGPDFQHGQQAQKSWLDQLTADQNDPTGNFGGISPDWNDIWSQTQKQVQQYYDGTATSPGINDQIKASFAQRGMSGDPAAAFLTSASRANEASDLSGLSSQENIAKQTFAQNAKQNWYADMNNFNNSTNSEQGNWSGAVVSPTPTQQIANAVGTASGGIASAAISANGQNNQLAYLNSFINNSSNPSSFASDPFSDLID